MNLVDVAIIVAIVLASIAGYRLGFLSRLLAWAGLALGITLSIVFLPNLVDFMRDASPTARVIGATTFVFGLAVLGQAVGYGLGALLHASFPMSARARSGDQVAGAVLGVVGTLAAVWLLVPAMAATPGWPSRAAQGSSIMRAINDYAPAPPQSLESAVERAINDTPFPEVRDPLDEPIATGSPPALDVPPAVQLKVASSVVKVEGQACDQVQDGTGWVADRDLVVTNAHVVAGESHTSVVLPNGTRRTGEVVEFDTHRDLAVIEVPNLGLTPLAMRDGDQGDTGAVYGHPGGGDLRVAPARVADRIIAVGTDIYRTAHTRRDVFVLASQLAPGDSGAPLADQQGRVIGVAFAIDPGHPDTSYALTTTEVGPVLDAAGNTPVPTGSCLVG